MANNIKCTCGHSWSKESSSGKDMNVCHICGKDNTMKNGGWLNKYEQGGMVLDQQPDDNYGKKPNPNDVQASVGPDFVGLGYDTTGRNYSPAWGGQFQDGGKLTLPEAIVYGHKDPKVKDYFDKVRTDAEKWRDEYYWNTPTAGYHALEQMHSKYGAPKINTIGEKDRAWYNPITDSMNISIPKYGDEYGNPVEDIFLDELAHKVQANKKGNVGFVKDFVGKDLINTLKNVDSSDIFTKKGWLDAYRKNYHTPGTVENEAHSVIAPKLEEEYRDIRSKQYDRLYGDMAMGGSLPGAVGFTYARTAGSAPANGKYTKKTKASAQNGKEMSFYQNGLDFKPKSISKNGSVIKDDRGQWAHPGEITEIGSNNITMQGVDYPVLGVSDTGDTKMMYPDQDYKFDGNKVTEFPMAQNGDWLSKYATEPMRQDATRVAPPVLKLTDEEKLANVAKSDQAQKRALNTAKEVIAERKKNKATKGDLNTPGSWHTEDKARLFPNSPGGLGEVIDEYINPATYVGVLADALGESVAARDPKGIALSLALSAGAGAMGLDPLGSTIKGVKAIPKVTRAGLNAIDRNFSSVGQDLAYFEKKGLKKGLSPYEIKKLQMEKVGITSSQREAYVPGVSDFLSKYVTPFGYKGGLPGENKLTQTLNNIKKGGQEYLPEYGSAVDSRKDSWNLFLGKPQKNNTFRLANTSPINHPAYTPEQLSNMDIYSLNGISNNMGIKPKDFNRIEDPITYYAQDMSSLEGSIHNKNPLKHNVDLLENSIVYDRHMPVMGGYNKRLSKTGLDYNDVWDLEPTVTNPITKKPMKVKIDNFIGKPFMSHGVFPEVTAESISKNLNEVISSELEQAINRQKYSPLKITKGKPELFETPIIGKINQEDGTYISQYDALDDMVRTSKDIKNLTNIKDRLKNIPKKEKGGWLNKYK